MLSWSLLPQENRYELFLNQINVYSHDELATKFEELGGAYKVLANRDSSHNAKLSDTEYNRELTNYLEEIKYLTSKKYETKTYEDPITFKNREEKFIVGRVKAKKVKNNEKSLMDLYIKIASLVFMFQQFYLSVDMLLKYSFKA